MNLVENRLVNIAGKSESGGAEKLALTYAHSHAWDREPGVAKYHPEPSPALCDDLEGRTGREGGLRTEGTYIYI